MHGQGIRSQNCGTARVSNECAKFCAALCEVVIVLVGFQQGEKSPSTFLHYASLVRGHWSMPYTGAGGKNITHIALLLALWHTLC